jgi:alpha-beta hydrolase superfamily lysophospholipase
MFRAILKAVAVVAVLQTFNCNEAQAIGPGKTTVTIKKRFKTAGTVATNRLPIWSKKVQVPYRAWIPVERPKQILLCVHGLGFSSESYGDFGRAMARRGVAVYALDVRGFGAWMDRNDDNLDFEACLSDIEAALHSLRKAYPSTPIFLVGESMGGAIALREASRNPDLMRGLICSVPSSDRYRKLSSELIVGVRYLKNKNKPMSLETEVVNRATNDPTLRKEIQANPSNRMKLTPKQLKLFSDFMKGNEDAAVLIQKTPTLMLAGFKDKLVKPEGTIDLFNEVSSQDKLLMVVGDGEHLLLEENQLTEQLEMLLLDWLKNESASSNRGVTAHR